MAPLSLAIKLHVRSLQNVEVDSEVTVAEFKEILAPLSDTPANNQRLIHRGHLLKDEKKLSEYGEGRSPRQQPALARAPTDGRCRELAPPLRTLRRVEPATRI